MGEFSRRMAKRVARYGDFIVAGILGLAAVGCFMLQILSFSEKTTPRELALFNALEFALTVGFGWFSTRAVSRLQFEESLRRFAVSAYRRIADTERMVHRLRVLLRGSLASGPAPGTPELRVVAAVVEDTLQVVKSSAADWADVIGDELMAIENIKRLEQERAELAERQEQETPAQGVLERLDKQIAELRSVLPASLRLDTHADEFEAEYAKAHAADWIADEHEKAAGGLALHVFAGPDNDVAALRLGDGLRLRVGGEGGLDAFDTAGTLRGRILNPSPLSYDDFVAALGACYGTPEVPVEFTGILNTRENGQRVWYQVKVKAEPRSRDECYTFLKEEADPKQDPT